MKFPEPTVNIKEIARKYHRAELEEEKNIGKSKRKLLTTALGSSRYLVVASDSATAAILAGGLSGLATAGSAHYVSLAGLVALLTAGFLLLARLLKLGFLAYCCRPLSISRCWIASCL